MVGGQSRSKFGQNGGHTSEATQPNQHGAGTNVFIFSSSSSLSSLSPSSSWSLTPSPPFHIPGILIITIVFINWTWQNNISISIPGDTLKTGAYLVDRGGEKIKSDFLGERDICSIRHPRFTDQEKSACKTQFQFYPQVFLWLQEKSLFGEWCDVMCKSSTSRCGDNKRKPRWGGACVQCGPGGFLHRRRHGRVLGDLGIWS